MRGQLPVCHRVLVIQSSDPFDNRPDIDRFLKIVFQNRAMFAGQLGTIG